MTKRLLLVVLLGLASLAAQVVVETPRPVPDVVPNALRNTNQFQRFWDLYTIRSNSDSQIPGGVRPPAAAIMGQAVPVPAPGSAVRATLGGASTAPPAVPLFAGNRWKGLGPAPILNGQIGATVPGRSVSGRMSALAVDPNNSNHWLVGGAGGGVWETLNAGNNWTALTDALPSLAVGAIAFAPSNSRVIYLGTGEANNSADSYGGQGLFKSTDGGLNWTLVNAQFAYGSFTSIWVDPATPNTLLASTSYGVFGRAAFFPPNALLPAIGVFRSTDGGVTWASTTINRNAYAMAVNPANKQQAIIGISNRGTTADASNGVYRSLDNGQTWAIISTAPWHNSATGVGRIELTIAASQPATAYVSIERASTGALLGLWRTDNLWDATPTWAQINVAPTDSGTGANGYCGWDRAFSSASNQCWYSHTVLASATDPNTLYAGGVPLWKYDGTTWTEISHTTAGIANGMHVDQHALAWAGTRLVVGNDGGIWSTTDGGTTINDHNIGLSTVQFYEGSVSTIGGTKRYLAGAQDNGTPLSIDNGATWNLSFGGDGAATTFSPTVANHWFVSSQNLNLARTINGGSYASTITGLDRTSTAFISKVEQCPFDENTVLAGNRSVQKRTDYYSGASNATWPASGAPFTLSSGISAIAFGSTCSVYAVGSKGTSFFMTRDGGTTWTSLRGTAAGVAALVRPGSDFAFVPGDDTTMWVALSAFDQDTPTAAGHVVKVTGLDTATPAFTLINTGVNMPHNTIVVDPGNNNIIYVGTDMGVVRSTDGGATWLPMGIGSGMPNVAVHDMKYSSDGVLVAFTHGRGAFELATYDITGDSQVDCADLNVIKLSYNKKSGQAGFNPIADLNNDGYVDVRDLRMMTRQLPAGTVCP